MKKFWQSKTFWVNTITLAVGVIGFIAGHEVIVKHPDIVALFVAIQGGLNVILRFLTDKSISI
jgi:hypothetical protein